jgi:hypothetical protein
MNMSDRELERIASMIEQDADAKGHQFSDCADVFMRLKIERTKERDELKYKLGTAEQALREACCLLEECLPHITGCQGNAYLNNRISVWMQSAGLPNAKDDGAPSGAPVHRLVGQTESQETK